MVAALRLTILKDEPQRRAALESLVAYAGHRRQRCGESGLVLPVIVATILARSNRLGLA